MKVFRLQIIKFLLIGTINTVLGYCVFALLVWLGFHFSVANLMGLIFGVFVGYLGNAKLVFDNLTKIGLIKYLFLWVFLYVLHTGIIAVFVYNGVNVYLSGIFALFLIVPVSYLLQKNYVFTHA